MRSRLLLVGVLVAAGFVVGTGGVSSIGADRGVTVATANDENAYMALDFSDESVTGTVDEDVTVDVVTVTNRLTEPVDITVDYEVTRQGESTATTTGTDSSDMAIGTGDSFDASATFTCDSHDTYILEFDVTADGNSVYVETTDPRTVEYDVTCESST